MEKALTTIYPDYRKNYSKVLLKYAEKNSGLSPVLSFGESNTESRVKHLMFMKRTKFYVNIAMVFVMCFCLMGCAANGVVVDDTGNDSELGSDREAPITLTVHSDLSSYEGLQEGWFADVLLEKFNVVLDIKMASNDLDVNQYVGDYDIIICGSKNSDNFKEAVENGHILDLSQKMETNMPYIAQYLTDSYVTFPEISADGIYAISTSTSNPGDYDYSYYRWGLRFDYYEELGKPVISDINDWVNVLKAMKEMHPTTEDGKTIYATDISLVEEVTNGLYYEVAHLVNAYYGYDTIGMGFYDWNTNQYYDALAINEDGSYGPYLTMLKVYNELYRNGLLYMDSDRGTITQEEAAMEENGQYLISMMNLQNENMYPVVPEKAQRLAYELGTISARCIGIDSETKYPELAMAVLDYFYSPEGMLTMTYGPEDVCWYYDAAGNTCLTQLGYDCYYDYETTLSDGTRFGDGVPMFNVVPYTLMATNTNNGEPYDFTYWKNVVVEPVNAVESAWREWTGEDSVVKYLYHLERCYIVSSTDVEYEPSDTTYENVSRLITDKCWEAIQAPTDTEFDAIVQDMITMATQAGYEQCVEYGENYIQKVLDSLK